jgi:hypothetical protein
VRNLRARVPLKINLSLCLTKHHATKVYWGSRCIAPLILNLGARWGEWSASRPGCFIPGKTTPDTHCTGGWVGPRAGLDDVTKRKILNPYRESNPGCPARSLVTVSTELSRLCFKNFYLYTDCSRMNMLIIIVSCA